MPKLIQQRIPVLVGGGGEKKTLRITAKYADMWHGFGNSSTLAHKMEVLDGWCKEVGRDPCEIERSAATNRADSDETRDSYVKVGVTHLILGMGAPWDFDAVRKLVRWRDSRR